MMYDSFEEFLARLRERSERHGFIIQDGRAVEKRTGLHPVAAVFHDDHQAALTKIPSNDFVMYYGRMLGLTHAILKDVVPQTPGRYTTKLHEACGFGEKEKQAA